MMKCPNCSSLLKETDFHNERVDICPGCGGSFYDKGELENIIDMVQLFQDVRLQEDEIDNLPDEEKRREVICPRDNQAMEPREIAGQVIDLCPQCRGIWLDKGEILALKIAENHIRENLNLYIRLGH